MWLGVLVAVLPLLGFPAGWKSVVFFISGVLIAVNSYQLSKHKVMRSRRAERGNKGNTLTQESSSTREEVKTSQISDIPGATYPKAEEPPSNPLVGR